MRLSAVVVPSALHREAVSVRPGFEPTVGMRPRPPGSGQPGLGRSLALPDLPGGPTHDLRRRHLPHPAGPGSEGRRALPGAHGRDQAEPGCRMYQVHRSPSDPQQFFIYEQYDDQAALDAHRAAPHFAGARPRRPVPDPREPDARDLRAAGRTRGPDGVEAACDAAAYCARTYACKPAQESPMAGERPSPPFGARKDAMETRVWHKVGEKRGRGARPDGRRPAPDRGEGRQGQAGGPRPGRRRWRRARTRRESAGRGRAAGDDPAGRGRARATPSVKFVHEAAGKPGLASSSRSARTPTAPRSPARRSSGRGCPPRSGARTSPSSRP